mgnify:CR=1 FL=1
MNGIKKFVTLRIPVYSCNFRCMYCYVGQHKNAYTRGIQPMIKGPEYIAKFFSKQKTGGGIILTAVQMGRQLFTLS